VVLVEFARVRLVPEPPNNLAAPVRTVSITSDCGAVKAKNDEKRRDEYEKKRTSEASKKKLTENKSKKRRRDSKRLSVAREAVSA